MTLEDYGTWLVYAAGRSPRSREGARWVLQVRSRVKLKSGIPGKDFAIGMASMSREDLVWLRDLIDVEIGER